MGAIFQNMELSNGLSSGRLRLHSRKNDPLDRERDSSSHRIVLPGDILRTEIDEIPSSV